MTTDKVLTYDLEGLGLFTGPPRSHLYHLVPIGIGTPFVESLTSYVSRLAEAHCVTLSSLVTHELLPLYGRSYLPSTTDDHNTSAFWKDSPALNGASPSARDFIRVLEQLTLHDNLRFLTMLPWAEVLSCRYLVRRTKAWCPFCYQEWLEEGMPIYDPLLWALEIATTCLRHASGLQKCCPHCNSRSAMLAPLGRPGHCSHCGAWLGVTSMLTNRHSDAMEEDELNWQRYVILPVGELLAASPALPYPPRRERFAQAIAEYLEDSADGKVSVLARKLHLSRRTIRDWKQGLQIPQLESLLLCCFLLDASPLDLFNASVSMSRDVSQKALTEQIEIKEKVKKRYRVLQVEKIRKALEAELLMQEGPPSPMCAVAKRLKYDHSFLRRHFPELCQAILDRYRAYRRKKREERKQTILDEVREMTFSVHDQELYPSQERVRLLLAKPGSIKEPGALAAWHEALQELGFVSRKP
jgi:transcriptional regulator with XRE-family HTH domain